MVISHLNWNSWLQHLHVASLCGLGFLTKRWLDSKEDYSKKKGAIQKLSSEVASIVYTASSYSRLSQSPAKLEGRGPNSTSFSRRAFRSGNITVTISGNTVCHVGLSRHGREPVGSIAGGGLVVGELCGAAAFGSKCQVWAWESGRKAWLEEVYWLEKQPEEDLGNSEGKQRTNKHTKR